MQSEGPYLVTVRLMCYNHAPYIKQALEGIWMQETDFPVEVVIGDDFSTDGTLDIIREYRANHQRQNLHWHILQREPGGEYQRKRQTDGRLVNFMDTINHCTGKYIALLDGDDYWTAIRKLQKQVDFMEAHPSYSICFHNAYIVDGNNARIREYYSDFEWNHIDRSRSKYGMPDLIKSPLCPTASVLLRKPDELQFPAWFSRVASGDMAFLMLHCGDGLIHYFDERWSAYRKHEGGITRTHYSDWIHVSRIYMYLKLSRHLPKELYRNLKEVIWSHLMEIRELKGLRISDALHLFSMYPQRTMTLYLQRARNRLRLRTRLIKLIQGR